MFQEEAPGLLGCSCLIFLFAALLLAIILTRFRLVAYELVNLVKIMTFLTIEYIIPPSIHSGPTIIFFVAMSLSIGQKTSLNLDPIKVV